MMDMPDWIFPGDCRDKKHLYAIGRWVDFAAHQDGYHAWRAIMAIARAGLTIPPELLPWLEQAHDTWTGSHHSAIKSIGTRESRHETMMAVHKLVLRGDKSIVAALIVAKANGLNRYTVEKVYKSSEWRAAKDNAKQFWIDLHEMYLSAGEDEKAAELEATYPFLREE